MAATSTAPQFVKALKALADATVIPSVSRFFRPDPEGHSGGNRFLGVKPGQVFPAAKQHQEIAIQDVEQLLESPYYEIRLGAVSIMDFQARQKRITAEQRQALFDLYLRRHDRINNWDLVDRAAPHVVGGYLADQSRTVLYDLARSSNPWERRTAIVSTAYFIRLNDLEDTFGIAKVLVGDPHEYVQKAVGSWIREAGKRDEKRLLKFMETHASRMPRPMLQYAVEKLRPKERERYLAAGKSPSR